MGIYRLRITLLRRRWRLRLRLRRRLRYRLKGDFLLLFWGWILGWGWGWGWWWTSLVQALFLFCDEMGNLWKEGFVCFVCLLLVWVYLVSLLMALKLKKREQKRVFLNKNKWYLI
ncbi:hypothetical protein V6Z11_A11G088400 [Gossypium hirsutum]